MREHAKKRVAAHELSDSDEEGEIAKGCALIRAHFRIDPTELDDDTWAMLFQEAVWLERTRLTNLARILGRLFAPDKTT